MKYQALTAALCLTALVGCTEGGTSGGNVQPETTTGAGSTTGNQLPPGPSTTGGGTTGSGTTGGGTTGSGTTGGGTTGGGTTGSGTTGGGNTGTLAGNMSNGANGNSLNDYWRCGESNRSESTNEYYVMLFLDDGSGAYLDSENELPFTWNTAGSTVQFVLNGDRRTFEYTSVDFYTANNFSSGFEVDGEFIENNRCDRYDLNNNPVGGSSTGGTTGSSTDGGSTDGGNGGNTPTTAQITNEDNGQEFLTAWECYNSNQVGFAFVFGANGRGAYFEQGDQDVTGIDSWGISGSNIQFSFGSNSGTISNVSMQDNDFFTSSDFVEAGASRGALSCQLVQL